MRSNILVFFFALSYLSISSQCNPPYALDFEVSYTFCSLDELDGFACATPSFSNHSGPNPLCFGTGVPHNTVWWSFVGDGQFIEIKFESIECEQNYGLQAGITEGNIGISLDCYALCENANSFTLSGQTTNCQIYYLWVDGCNADICEFVITTYGGTKVRLPKVFPPQIIDPGCPGGTATICGSKLQNCSPFYSWIIDGNEQITTNNECLEYELPESIYPIEICLSYFIGNPHNPISICDESSIMCITLKPDTISIVREGIIELCQTKGKYKWHGSYPDSVFNDSIYIVIAKDENDNCFVEYHADSIILIPPKTIPNITKIICDVNDLPYLTEDGREWNYEVCDEYISWNINEICDTVYRLNLIIFSPKVSINKNCFICDGFTTLTSQVQYDSPCLGGSLTIEGYWMNRNMDIIGVGDTIRLNNHGRYFYGMNLSFLDTLNNSTKNCSVFDTTNWYIDLNSLPMNKPVLFGNNTPCISSIHTYSIRDTQLNICGYNWKITNNGGAILTPNSEDSSIIRVLWNDNSTLNPQLCVSVKSACSESEVSCLDIKINKYPKIENIEFQCNIDNLAYRMLIILFGSELNSVKIEDTTGLIFELIDSSTYLSEWIPNGTRVVINISDKYKCHITKIDTSYDCIILSSDKIESVCYKISPNPAYDFIHIATDKIGINLHEMNVRIIDIRGKSIIALPKTDIGGGVLLDVSKLSAGMYFIQLINGDEMEVVKFVKIGN